MTQPSVTSEAAEPIKPVQASLGQLAAYFTRLGFTAFGGPAAHVAMMERDLVQEKRWISRQHFLDVMAATQLVPGPNSTETAIHMGYHQRGVPGLLVAGACFILPAFLLVLLISIGYVAYGSLPQVDAIFYGIQPVIVAIIVQAAYRLGKTACRTALMIGMAVVGGLLTLVTPLDTVWVILGGGVVGILIFRGVDLFKSASSMLLALPVAALPTLAAQAETTVAPLWRLGLFFLKVGATLMGSGYVLISYMEHDLVRNGWLTRQEIIDAIAVGQMTPGPVFTTAAFAGYVNQAGADGNIAAGIVGAAVCALAIFLPSFFIVLLIAPWIPRLRGSKTAGSFLDGVNAVVVGSIAATTWTFLLAATIDLANPTIALPLAGISIDLPALLLALGSIVVLLRWPQINSTILIAVGALSGLLLQSVL
jgi:chromate transporter